MGNICHGFFDIAAHIFGFVQLGFLGQVTNIDAGLGTGFTFNLGINTGHNAQQRGFTGAV